MFGPIDGIALYECLAGVGVGFMWGFLFGCDWVRDQAKPPKP